MKAKISQRTEFLDKFRNKQKQIVDNSNDKENVTGIFDAMNMLEDYMNQRIVKEIKNDVEEYITCVKSELDETHSEIKEANEIWKQRKEELDKYSAAVHDVIISNGDFEVAIPRQVVNVFCATSALALVVGFVGLLKRK